MAEDSKMPNPVRADFVPASDYICPQFLARENEAIWPHAWLVACREEDISEPGDFHVFDIVRDTIAVVRQQDGAIKAFHNICRHRGRRLLEGSGHVSRKIHCRFHGWSWKVDGSIQRVVNREEWEGCPGFDDADLALPEVRVDCWGGWVWICMDPAAPSLAAFLGDAPAFLDPFELDTVREIWSATLTVPANWKLVLNAFNEGYHVEATHAQTQKYHSTRMPSHEHGLHAMFGPVLYDEKELPNRPSALEALKRDPRELNLESNRERSSMLRALYLEPSIRAAERVLADLPDGASAAEVQALFFPYNVEEIERTGASWPKRLTPEAIRAAGFGWHLFPNFIVLLANDGIMAYRTRPHPTDPDQCLWDIWSFGRFAPDAEPEPVRTVIERFEDAKGFNTFLDDDLANLPDVQRGMHSRAFSALRTNPVQEVTVSHLHRVIHDWIDGRRDW